MPLARHDNIGGLSVSDRHPFLLTCLLRGMTTTDFAIPYNGTVSTHMPLARHDKSRIYPGAGRMVSTHMPIARHDGWSPGSDDGRPEFLLTCLLRGMTYIEYNNRLLELGFYSHASCEA